MTPSDGTPIARPAGDPGRPASTGERVERLGDAMEAYLRFCDRSEGLDRDAFLARYADLRDLLEPMLAAADDEAPEEAVAAPNPAGLQPGRRVGDYRIVREVGRGGMGIVFEAEQSSLRRRVALKLLHPHLSWSASSIERFRKEAAAVARLCHPAIVPIHEVGEWRGLHYFSMEFVDGEPLSERLHKERFGVVAGVSRAREAAELVARVADALQHAHEHGLVHRDVKPHNIMVGDDGAVRLLDFGLVKNVEAASQSATGGFLGTPHYCSPEQVARGAVVGPRTDVFSLAIVLYELLTRRRPFDGETAGMVLERIETGDYEPVRRVAPSVPRDLETVCQKGLEVEPAARYESAGAFAADLRRFLAIEPILARPPGPAVRGLKWVRRHRTQVALGLLAALVVVGTPTGYALHQYNTALTIERERRALGQAEALGFQSIEQTLTLLGEQLERLPGLPEGHSARVDDVVRLCENFLQQRAEDQGRRARVARALYVTSHVYARIGRHDAATSACDRALELVRSTAGVDLGALEDRLLRRRFQMRQYAEPDMSSAEFEAAVAPWHELATGGPCDVEIALDYADMLLLRGRTLADRPRERPEAERLLRRALEVLPRERWLEDERAEITALRARTVLGVLLLATDRAMDALEILLPTEARFRELPQTPLIGIERILATAAIGEARQQLGQAGAAEVSLREAIASGAALSEEYPGARALRRTLLRSRVRLGVALMAMRKGEAAEEVLRAVQAEIDPEVDLHVDVSLRAEAQLQLANSILMRTRGTERREAPALLESARATLERLVAGGSDPPRFEASLCSALNSLAGIANEDGAHADAVRHATRAIALQRGLAATGPRRAQARLFLGVHLSQLALASAHLGDLDAARVAAREAMQHGARHTGTLRLAAEAACICAERVATQGHAGDAGGAAEECASLAVAGLRAIAARNPGEARRWLEAERFAFLRNRDDVHQLLEETRR